MYDQIRNAFHRAFEAQMKSAYVPKTVQFPEAFHRNLERSARLAAFDAAAEAVAHAQRTMDELKVRAVLRRAGIKYVPPVRSSCGLTLLPGTAFTKDEVDYERQVKFQNEITLENDPFVPSEDEVAEEIEAIERHLEQRAA